MRHVLSGLGVVAATAAAGLGFAPLFGGQALVVALSVVCASALVADLATSRRFGFLRAPLAVVLAVLGLIPTMLRATTTDGWLPTGHTWSALLDGVVNGWPRVLDSTWPARPEPATMLFVPAMALAAAVLGLELSRRRFSPLSAVLPAAAVLGVSQCFVAATGVDAVLLGAGFAVACGLVLATAPAPGALEPVAEARSAPGSKPWLLPALVTVVAMVAGLVVFAVTTSDREPYSVAAGRQSPRLVSSVANPLTDIGARLSTPDTVVFRDRTDSAVDRWTAAVLDRFDGTTWTTSAKFQDMGSELPPAQDVTAPLRARQAEIDIESAPGTWLPTQPRTATVEGTNPLVDPATGILLSTETASLRYRLGWRAPELPADALATASIGQRGADLSGVPPAIVDLAREATGGRGASVTTALALESWLRRGYQVATGDDIPTGHGYAQLHYFLTTSKRGTSEQFATAYAVLARTVGIQTRIAVGFRQPARPGDDGRFVVRNADVLAWPEILVPSVGWIALDPTGTTSAASADDSVAKAIEKARDTVVPAPKTEKAPEKRATEPKAPARDAAPPAESSQAWALWLVLGLVLVTLTVAAAPLAKWWRRRSRRGGSTAASVVGAWLEARDRLREQGAHIHAAMTVRDVARSVAPLASGELDVLTRCVDMAVWSGQPVAPQLAEAAWAASDAVSRMASGKGVRAKALRVFSLRGLRPPPP